MSDSASESVFRILLVEDAPDQSLLLSAVLQKLGPFDVTLVQDGVQALELAKKGGFDLVLTDLNLPGMDGFDLTRRLKAAFPDMPVLAATGYTDPGYAEGAYRAGVDALMTKPVDPDDLEARLRELLPRWRTHDGPPAVLAVGARPGEVELGCGASLAAHHAAGHDVLVVVFGLDRDDERAEERTRRASEQLGVRLLLAEEGVDDPEGTAARSLLIRLVKELAPAWAYLPSGADRDEARLAVHRAAREATRSVPTVLAYASAGTGLAFSPEVFRDVAGWMDAKLGALAYHQSGRTDPASSPDFALAQARYWGRFKDFGEVEPFELLDGDTDDEAPEVGTPDASPGDADTPEAEPVHDDAVDVGAIEAVPAPDEATQDAPDDTPGDAPAPPATPPPAPPRLPPPVIPPSWPSGSG